MISAILDNPDPPIAWKIWALAQWALVIGVAHSYFRYIVDGHLVHVST